MLEQELLTSTVKLWIPQNLPVHFFKYLDFNKCKQQIWFMLATNVSANQESTGQKLFTKYESKLGLPVFLKRSY